MRKRTGDFVLQRIPLPAQLRHLAIQIPQLVPQLVTLHPQTLLTVLHIHEALFEVFVTRFHAGELVSQIFVGLRLQAVVGRQLLPKGMLCLAAHLLYAITPRPLQTRHLAAVALLQGASQFVERGLTLLAQLGHNFLLPRLALDLHFAQAVADATLFSAPRFQGIRAGFSANSLDRSFVLFAQCLHSLRASNTHENNADTCTKTKHVC